MVGINNHYSSITGNRLHFGFMDFAGHVEPVLKDSRIQYLVSITKDGVKFKENYFDWLEDAINFINEYDKQIKAEKD